MSCTLRITAKLHVTPLFDIRQQDVATAYREGLYEHLQNSLDLVAVSHLVICLQRAIAVSTFDGQHQAAARDFVGYHVGSLHGTVLTPSGTYRRDVATLAALDGTDAQRGYRAGRSWFFTESTPQERRLTDEYLIGRLYEISRECTEWHDPEEVWQYAIACLLGELSGHLFPITQEEHVYWEAERQVALTWMARQEARRDTELILAYPTSQQI
jgi:hypothetical protein